VSETDDQQPPVSATSEPSTTADTTSVDPAGAAPETVDDPSADVEVPAEAPVVTEDTDERPGDPFEGWPAADSAAEIEESLPDGASVEHVRGEVDVPDGYTVLEGTPLGNRRSVGVVVSRFNGGITNRMLSSALDALISAGVAQDAITVMPVPGAFELPLAAMALAKTRRYACIVALGAIVRGGTPHFEYVAAECASGLQLAAIETGVPVAFGVLTVDDVDQAEARIDKAGEAARSALEMADLFARLRASARQ
jgi:6,7-dimethyl-8-ribityllumazine synthase